MDTNPVLFLDSGLGCLPYAAQFCRQNPDQRVVAVADRAHFPYGPRSKPDLIVILKTLAADIIHRFQPLMIVIACNTASVSALDDLRLEYPAMPFVGTVPAVKPATLASKKGRVGVLGTERTVEDPCIRLLAEKYDKNCDITAVAAPALVEFVEKRSFAADREERLAAVRPWVERFRDAGCDAIVLGCTHFLLLIDEFHEIGIEAGLGVYDSVNGVVSRAESILTTETAKNTNGAKEEKHASPLLYLTGDGPLEAYWQPITRRYGFAIERWEKDGAL
jgi:glutamate racemase